MTGLIILFVAIFCGVTLFRINLTASLIEIPPRCRNINIRLIAHNIIVGKKYSPRRVCLSRGSFIIELREESFAHNTNLSIIAAFQSESSFSTKRKKLKKKEEKKGELNYEISEQLERRILRKRGDEGRAGSVYAKPAR